LVSPSNFSILRNNAWAISNLVRGKPAPTFEAVRGFIGPLVDILRNCGDPTLQGNDTMELRTDTVWAISYLADGNDDRIQAVIDSGVIPLLLDILQSFHQSRELLIPTVRALGNIVSGNDKQTQAVIDAGLLSHMSALLQIPSVSPAVTMDLQFHGTKGMTR